MTNGTADRAGKGAFVGPGRDGNPARRVLLARGSQSRPADEMVHFLREAAQHRARRALRLYRSADSMDLLDAGADAGGAVELLAKACIATVEPSLLAKGVSGLALAETLLQLRGLPHLLTSSRERRLSTIEAGLAVELAERLFPKLAPATASARLALEARNDSLHMGIAIADRVDAAVAGMAAYVRAVLSVLGVSHAHFWAQEEDMVAADRVVSDRTTHIAEVVEAKIEQAQARCERFVIRVGEDRAADVIHEIQIREMDPDRYRGGFTVQCPACQQYGWVDVDADFEAEPDGEGGFDYFQTAQWVAGFRCPVCELELDSEECEEAGIGQETDEDEERDR